jgi:hypothetical protein
LFLGFSILIYLIIWLPFYTKSSAKTSFNLSVLKVCGIIFYIKIYLSMGEIVLSLEKRQLDLKEALSGTFDSLMGSRLPYAESILHRIGMLLATNLIA